MAKKFAQGTLIALMVAALFACAANQPATKGEIPNEGNLYGFYSQEANQKGYGVFSWETPDGRQVTLTHTTPDPTGSDYHFADKIARGIVTKYIKTIQEPREWPEYQMNK